MKIQNNHNLYKNKAFLCNDILIKKRGNVSIVHFNGSYYPSGYYTDSEIADTYKYINKSDTEWRENGGIRNL